MLGHEFTELDAVTKNVALVQVECPSLNMSFLEISARFGESPNYIFVSMIRKPVCISAVSWDHLPSTALRTRTSMISYPGLYPCFVSIHDVKKVQHLGCVCPSASTTVLF